MKTSLTAECAESLFSWRNDDPTLGRRIMMEAALPVLITAGVVETVARVIFCLLSPILSCFSSDFARDWGSWEHVKDTIELLPMLSLALVDNIYSSNLDKDDACLMHTYFRIVYGDGDDD